jgi:hypothetical protein
LATIVDASSAYHPEAQLCVSLPPCLSVVAEHVIRESSVDLRSSLLDVMSSTKQALIVASPSPWQRAYVERAIGTIRRERLDHVFVFSETACLATCEDSRTIIIGVARTWACRRTRPSRAPSKQQKPGGSSPSRRWVGSIIVTNVAPPESSRAQQQITLLRIHRRLSLRHGPADRGDVIWRQPPLHSARISASVVHVSLRVPDRKTGHPRGWAL